MFASACAVSATTGICRVCSSALIAESLPPIEPGAADIHQYQAGGPHALGIHIRSNCAPRAPDAVILQDRGVNDPVILVVLDEQDV